MKKRMISLLLMVCMVLMYLPVSAFALGDVFGIEVYGVQDGKSYCGPQKVVLKAVDGKIRNLVIDGLNWIGEPGNWIEFTLEPGENLNHTFSAVYDGRGSTTIEVSVNIYEAHADEDGDCVCDHCGETIHTDEDKNCVCDTCDAQLSHADEDKNCVCDVCGVSLEHTDADENCYCDVCGKAVHKDEDKDHLCDVCSDIVSQHVLIHVPAQPATEEADGNTEYWYCEGCGKVYSDEAGETEISCEETVLGKIYTFTVAFTTTVKQASNGAPDATDFTLEPVFTELPDVFDNVTISGTTISTDGVGNYYGTVTIRGSITDLRACFAEGMYIRQRNDGKANWTYDDTVWALWLMEDGADDLSDSLEEGSYSMVIYPTVWEASDDGERYYYTDLEGSPVKNMSFTNTYTKTIVDPTSPPTGDSSGIVDVIAILCVSGVALAALAVLNARKKKEV